MFSVDVSIESRRRENTAPQYGYEAQAEDQQEGSNEEEEEEFESSDEHGAVISEGFVEDILEKAETKAQEIVASAIEAAFVERNYEFKIDLLTEKNEARIEELKKDFEERLIEREKTIK